MGGEGAESQETRATEASVRGFWKAYRRLHGLLTCRRWTRWPQGRSPACGSSTRSTRAALDDDRLEDWPDFFADDCLYKVTSSDNHRQGMAVGIIYADSKDMVRDRVAALRRANIYERQSYRHIVGMPALLGEDGGAVRAETPFLVARIMRDGTTDLFATGRYLDLLVEEGGALRFRERLVVCDSSRVDTLLAIPL